jgi:hypothetical protein
MTMTIWCSAMERFVSLQGCDLKLGSANGSLTAPCPYEGTNKCPLLKKKEETSG